jgi:hypothetical protein
MRGILKEPASFIGSQLPGKNTERIFKRARFLAKKWNEFSREPAS